jgi:hypothetical protein
MVRAPPSFYKKFNLMHATYVQARETAQALAVSLKGVGT